MSCKRGDVVLYDAGFVDKSGKKLRPMLVVQNNTNNTRMNNTILVSITTNISRAHEDTQVLIAVATPEGQKSGLRQDSVVACENIFTVLQAAIGPTIGHLPDSLMEEVDSALKVSLALL